MGKKILQVSVKLSESDFKMFMKAAKKVWPRAEITRAAALLSFARIGVEAASSPEIMEKLDARNPKN